MPMRLLQEGIDTLAKKGKTKTAKRRKSLREIEDYIDKKAAEKALKEPGRIPWEKIKKDLGLT